MNLNTRDPEGLPIRLTLLLTSTLTVMAAATVSPALPAMQATFADVPRADLWVRLVLTLPALFIVLGAPIVGLIVDRSGRKRILIAAVVLYGLAGTSGFYLQSLGPILVGRAFLGLSVAAIMTVVTTLIADYYAGTARVKMLGYQAAFMGLSATIFLILAGVLADIDWHFAFLVYSFAWILLPAVIFLLPEPERRRPPKVDGQAAPTADPLPIRFMTLLYGLMFFIQVIFYVVPVQLPFHLQAISGSGATETGLAIALLSIAYATGSILSARVAGRVGRSLTVTLAFSVAGGGYLVVWLATSFVMTLPGLAAAGLGLGLVIPNLTAWLAGAVPDTIRGRALGGVTTATFLGQFMSPILLQPAATNLGISATFALLGVTLAGLALVVYLARPFDPSPVAAGPG